MSRMGLEVEDRTATSLRLGHWDTFELQVYTSTSPVESVVWSVCLGFDLSCCSSKTSIAQVWPDGARYEGLFPCFDVFCSSLVKLHPRSLESLSVGCPKWVDGGKMW